MRFTPSFYVHTLSLVDHSPIHGVPILVKDNIATEDDLDVSGGSYALLGAKPANESSVVRRLRDAGAIILGKTNLSEWANFRGLDISSGWSPRGGQALGIYRPGTSPGGSSSGSAIAAALGLSTAALGTEVTQTHFIHRLPHCPHVPFGVLTALRTRGFTSAFAFSQLVAGTSLALKPHPMCSHVSWTTLHVQFWSTCENGISFVNSSG